MRWNCILEIPIAMCFRNLTCLSQMKALEIKFSAMNPNTKRSKKFRKEFKKDPEKLEVYLKKDI